MLAVFFALAPSPLEKITDKAYAQQAKQIQIDRKGEIVALTATQLAQAVEIAPPAKPTFNPEDRSTWPVCAENEIVRADNGQCAAKLVPPTPVAQTAPAPIVSAPVQVGGNCASWMAQAGIPSTHATNKLILNESGCNPRAINPISGACGIPQSLPCSKMGCSLSDPVCQLRWMAKYVAERYGSWEKAYSTWQSRSPHWY